jgi:hypothetical protein
MNYILIYLVATSWYSAGHYSNWSFTQESHNTDMHLDFHSFGNDTTTIQQDVIAQSSLDEADVSSTPSDQRLIKADAESFRPNGKASIQALPPVVVPVPVISTTATATPKSENATTQQDTQLCFVTSEFSKTVEVADVLPTIPESMRAAPGRHFAFTNQAGLKADGWQKIILNDTEWPIADYSRQITKSRWPKFMGWQHSALQHCEVVFYGDAHFMNPINETVWMSMANSIKASDVGLMQDKQVGRRDQDGPVKELQHNARIQKDSWETANYTIDWLRNQTDYKRNTRVYKNALFGYDPSNPRFQAFVEEFWQEYSREAGSWRDQPYWAYYLSKHNIKPLKIPKVAPMGKKGVQGHNGHVYVQKRN